MNKSVIVKLLANFKWSQLDELKLVEIAKILGIEV
jgi:hypothetical protein